MRSTVQAAPNVTPMVDVMLVLLIIFMVIAPALLDGFVVEPPAAHNLRDHPNDSTDVTLGIDASGNYYLNKARVAPAELGAKLRAIFGGADPNHVLYLTADRNLNYNEVLAVLDSARNNGVVVIGMISQKPADPRP
jgi:biopolymer transport protein ExbD